MKLVNFGGATAILEHEGKRMLFDPWLDDGIFHGSWYHFPPTTLGVKDIGHIDYVYISHIHEDHCSLGTLKHINKDAEIILMDRQPNLVLMFLNNNNLNFKKIHLVKTRTPYQIGEGIIVDIIEANPDDEMSHLIDSSLVINWKGFKIFNANDCQPHINGIQYLLNNYGKVDLALLPYSGGSGYPSCYINLSEEKKKSEKNRIIDSRIKSFIDNVRLINPVYAVPFADQWVVGGSRSELNKFVAHSSCRSVVCDPFIKAKLNSKLLLLNSGQSYNFDSSKKHPNSPYILQTDSVRDKYINNSLSNVRYDHEKFIIGYGVNVVRLIQYARSRLWDVQVKQNYYPDYSFYLDVLDTNQRFFIQLNTRETEILLLDSELVEPHLRIIMPRNLLIMILIGHISWNIADAAFFLDYSRIPNTYDPKIYALLNYIKI
jgi:UDP-MurNAc hydroxylase